MKSAALAAALLASAAPVAAQQVDTSAVAVRGPTVVACYRVAQGQVDADDDLATVLDDFSWHWSHASESLRGHGVAAEDRFGEWVKLRTDSRLRLVRCPRPVGYVFAAPGRLPKVVTGVETDSDLLERAAAYFRRPELASGKGSDGRHR
ncbi:hypothetical protein [Longimicrobium sp.]|uniref:hypothetical protein n=1 Tax=Longimicrobium sp. TaxID=2029185 RepID=UPI002CC9B1ED|nr:hypothetical protein [Longimicrobium sp.]HSU16003.1 hypothetical protein [Longimicrobium sp.]